MMETTVVACPQRGQKLRIPTDRNLAVMCPKCRTTSHHYQAVVEYCVLRFACSVIGEKFKVIFGRRTPTGRFVVLSVSEEDIPTITPRATAEMTVSPDHEFDASEFDFSGWYCGRCKWRRRDKQVTPSFVRCGRCKEMVCGRRSYKADSKTYFKYYNSCGLDAPTSGGGIGKVIGEKFTVGPQTLEGRGEVKKLDPGQPLMLLPEKN